MDISFKEYNKNSSSVKRILSEYRELKKNKSSYYTAFPLEDNIYEWHFTIRGPRDSEFEGGIYHGRIILPEEYPLRPPDIIFSTENGRFEVEKKICLTISSHHEETWMPGWSIRTALIALIDFMTTRGDGAIASLDWSKEERKRLAKASLSFKCEKCGTYAMTALPPEDINDVLERRPEEMVLVDSKINKEEKKGDDDLEKKESIIVNEEIEIKEVENIINEDGNNNINENITIIRRNKRIEIEKSDNNNVGLLNNNEERISSNSNNNNNQQVVGQSSFVKTVFDFTIFILLMTIFIITKKIMSTDYSKIEPQFKY